MTTTTELEAHHIDEFGFAVKGWDLDLDKAARVGCEGFAGYDSECDEHASGSCEFPTYGIAEVWIRRRPAVENSDYSEIFDHAKPHSRGAGRFTVFYYDYNRYEVHRQIQKSRSE